MLDPVGAVVDIGGVVGGGCGVVVGCAGRGQHR